MMKRLLMLLICLTSLPAFSSVHWVNAIPGRFDKLIERGRFAFPAQVWWELNFSKGISADLVVDGNYIFLACKDGTLYAINMLEGSISWTFPTGAPIISSPALDNEKIFFGNTAGDCFAIHSKTGELIWHRKVSTFPLTGIAAEQDIVCCSNRQGEICCLDGTSGEIRTTFSLPEPTYAPPLLDEGVLYIGCDDFFMYAFETAPPGKLLWQYQCDGEVRCPAVIEDAHIYFGSDDRYLYALEKKTGSRKWRARAGNAIRSRPVIRQSLIFFTSLDNRLYVVKKKSGDLELMQYFSSRLYTSPVLLDQIVVVTPFGSKIGIYDIEKNKTLESVEVGGILSTSPIFSHNTLFVCTSDVGNGKLLALIKESESTVGRLATPKNGRAVMGICEVKGWALDKLGVDRVEIWLDNQPIGEAEYGEARADVLKTYPGYVGAANAGFNFQWDTTQFPDGYRNFAVRIYNLAGHFLEIGQITTQVINHPFSSGEGESPFYSEYIESDKKAD